MSIITYLTDKFLTEEKLDSLILECEDLQLLSELLEIKRCYINKNQQHAIYFPVEKLLHSINTADTNIICRALRTALLIQKDDSQFLLLSAFINTYIDQSNAETSSLNTSLDLITVLLNVCEHRNKTLDLQNFESLFSKITTSDDKKLSYYFCVTILPMYLKYMNADTKIVETCLYLAVERKNLDLLCLLFDFLLHSKYKSEVLVVLNDSAFWLFIQSTLTNTSQSFAQKQATFILQQMIYFVLENDISLKVHADIVKMQSVAFDDTLTAWKNYFILLDISKEKQLHLIQPSIPILGSIFCLHYTWIVCLLKILFCHSQNQVVFATVNKLLKSEWLKNVNNFSAVAPNLLLAINKIEYFNLSLETYNLLLDFINLSHDDVFIALLEETCKVSWNPVVLWVFLKAICNRNNKICIPLSLIQNILLVLHKVPHKYIREGCVGLFIRFLSKRCLNQYRLESLIKISSILSNIEKFLFRNFCVVFKDVILSHKQSISRKLSSVQATEEVEILIEFAKTCGCIELTNIFARNEVFVINKLCTTLYSSMDNKLKNELILHIKKQLTSLKNKENIIDLKFLVHLLSADETFHKKHEAQIDNLIDSAIAILKNDSNINAKQQELALEILATLDNKNYSTEILSHWIIEYKKANSTITEGLSLSILKIYFKQLEENVNTGDDLQELSAVIEDSFELQHDDVLLYIFETLPKHLRAFDNHHYLLKRAVKEIVNLKKTSLFTTAVEKLLTSIFKHVQMFDEHVEDFLELLDTFLELSKSYDFIASLLAEQIKTLAYANPRYLRYCPWIIVDLLVEGAWSRKEQR